MTEKQFLTAIGAQIKQIRKDRRMTQSKVGELCNIDKAGMSRLEAGKGNPSALTLRKLGKALNVSVAEFFRN